MYEQSASNKNTAFTFGNKNKETYNQNPGPGSYNAIPETTKDSARTYVMGSEKRKTQFGSTNEGSSMPGPGMYERNDSSNSKSYTIGSKTKEKYN